MSELIIRDMLRSDAKRVAEISANSWKFAYRGLMPDLVLDNIDIQKREINWREGFDTLPNLIRIVACENNQVIGFASGRDFREEDSQFKGELWAIYVEPEYMGKGVGKALMQEFKLRLRTLEFKEMYVWVLHNNKQAQQFYQKNAGQLTEKTKFFSIDGHDLKEVCYKFTLEV